jgi:hypothetical protein
LADGEANLRIFAAKDIFQLRNNRKQANLLPSHSFKFLFFPFQSLASHLLSDPSSLPEFKEQLSRLLNAIASFRHGRDYLLVASSQGRQLIYETAMALKGRRVVGHAVEHLLAALQKLSIRTGAQKELLMNGKFCPQMNDKNSSNSPNSLLQINPIPDCDFTTIYF